MKNRELASKALQIMPWINAYRILWKDPEEPNAADLRKTHQKLCSLEAKICGYDLFEPLWLKYCEDMEFENDLHYELEHFYFIGVIAPQSIRWKLDKTNIEEFMQWNDNQPKRQRISED